MIAHLTPFNSHLSSPYLKCCECTVRSLFRIVTANEAVGQLVTCYYSEWTYIIKEKALSSQLDKNVPAVAIIYLCSGNFPAKNYTT